MNVKEIISKYSVLVLGTTIGTAIAFVLSPIVGSIVVGVAMVVHSVQHFVTTFFEHAKEDLIAKALQEKTDFLITSKKDLETGLQDVKAVVADLKAFGKVVEQFAVQVKNNTQTQAHRLTNLFNDPNL